MMRAVRTVGTAVAASLGAVGVLHAVWARSTWPLDGPAEFADAVVGVDQDRMPTPAMCLEVAGALGVAGYLVGARAGVLPPAGPRWVRTAGAGVAAAALLGRGLAGPALFGTGRIPRTERFRRLDRRYYSPLCLALGSAAAVVAVRGQ